MFFSIIIQLHKNVHNASGKKKKKKNRLVIYVTFHSADELDEAFKNNFVVKNGAHFYLYVRYK